MWRDRLGGTASVADRIGFVRTESLGTLFNRSADLVSSFRRLGTLGRRGGAGRRKPIDDGGGDGDASVTFVAGINVREGGEVVEGMTEGGICGEGGFEEVDDEGSISGSFLDRRALWVSSWNKPELLRAT